MTLLLLSRRWRRFWPAFCAPAGWFLQSTVVLVGAQGPWRGTDHYAWASLAIPTLLLGLAFWRDGVGWTLRHLLYLRRWSALLVIMGGSFALQIYPFTKPPAVLTAQTLGSCQAADFAAGARALQEFSSDDPAGVSGLREVRRADRFVPSALLALNASLLRVKTYQLSSLLAVVLLTLGCPSVFWLARSAFRFGRLGSLFVTLLYAFSPIMLYVVYQDALDLLLAGPAIALLIWVAGKAYRKPAKWSRYVAPFIGGGWLLLLVLDATPLGGRIAGFQASGWFGLFADPLLQPATGWWPPLVSGLCLAALAWAIWREWRRSPRLTGQLAVWTLPICTGYGLLLWQGGHHHESEIAFRLFVVFYPALLAGLCLWMRACRGASGWAQAWGGVLCVLLITVQVQGAERFNLLVRKQALVLDPDIIRIGTIESAAGVGAVNVCLQEEWARNWANYFLLRNPPYFALPIYARRQVTPLHGEWDLRDKLLEVQTSVPGDQFPLDDGFYLLKRVGSPEFVDLGFGEGWYPPEHYRTQYWCWSRGAAQILVTNPHAYPLQGTVDMALRSVHPGHVRLLAGAAVQWEGAVGVAVSTFATPVMTFAPGANVLRLESVEPAAADTPGDARTLAFALCQWRLALKRAP